MRELPVAERHDLVSRGERVGQRRLPPARAGARVDERRALFRAENHLRVLEALFEEGREPGVAVVLRGPVHGAEDVFVDVDGPGDEEVVAARRGEGVGGRLRRGGGRGREAAEQGGGRGGRGGGDARRAAGCRSSEGLLLESVFADARIGEREGGRKERERDREREGRREQQNERGKRAAKREREEESGKTREREARKIVPSR